MKAGDFIKNNYHLTNGGEDYVCNETGQLVGAEDIAEAYHISMLPDAKIIEVAPELLRELQKVRLDIKLSGAFKEESPIVIGIDRVIKKATE